MFGSEGGFSSRGVIGIEHIVGVAIVTEGDNNLVGILRIDSDGGHALATDFRKDNLGGGDSKRRVGDGTRSLVEDGLQVRHAEESSFLGTDEQVVSIG